MKSRSIAGTMLVLMLVLVASVPMTSMAAGEPAKMDGMAGMKMSDASAMSSGEVRKVDKEAGKVTIKHGPLTNLDMPAMTMVFRVSDPSILDQVKPGDQIHFVAEKANGALIVSKIEVMK